MTKFNLSPRLIGLYAFFFLLGLITGGIQYAHRTSVREHHASDTSAWTVHLVLTAVAILGYLVWRRYRPGVPLFTAPLGRAAERRIRAIGPVRLVLVTLPALALPYFCWRAGEQVLAGLDPNFTANAWGGPSYLGAMYCHYLDGLLITIACAGLVNLVLPRLSDQLPNQSRKSASIGSR